MTITQRDKRALIGLAVVASLILIWRFASADDETAPQVVPAAAESIPSAERRLARLRQITAAVPGKQQILDQVSAELATREKGIIEAESAQQAQAQLMQILRKIARAQTPPLDFRNAEIGPVRAYGDHYGEAVVSVSFDAGIEQVVNLMADLTAQNEMIATNEIRFGAAHPKQKILPVRLTVSGLVRKQLVPAKRGLGAL